MTELNQAEKNVFGENAVKDDFGNIVEKGIGALKPVAPSVTAEGEKYDTGPLVERLAELEAENAALTSAKSALEASNSAGIARIADDANLIAGLEAKVAELTKQVDDLTAPAADM